MSSTIQDSVDTMIYLYNIKYGTNSQRKPGIFTKELADAFIKETNLKAIFEEIVSYGLDETKLRDIFNTIITQKSKGIITIDTVRTTNSNSNSIEIKVKNPTGYFSLFTPKKSFKIRAQNIKKINPNNIGIITKLQTYFFDTRNPSICSTIRRTIEKFNNINASKLFLDFVVHLIQNPNSILNNKKKFEDLLKNLNHKSEPDIKESISNNIKVASISVSVLSKDSTSIYKIIGFNIEFNKFILEIYILMYLEYFNINFIPKIIEVFKINNNSLVIKMDYLGNTLNDNLSSRTVIELSKYIIDLCNKLNILQNIGFIHGDLSIENITVKDDSVNIIDFGDSLLYRFDDKLINNYVNELLLPMEARLYFDHSDLRAFDLLFLIHNLYSVIISLCRRNNGSFNQQCKFAKLINKIEEISIFKEIDSYIVNNNIDQIINRNIFTFICTLNNNNNYTKKIKKEINQYKYTFYNNEIMVFKDNKEIVKLEIRRDNIKNFYPDQLSKIMKDFYEKQQQKS